MNVSKPPVRQARGDATRRAILDAAETIFAEMGYAAARLEDVAQAVGIRRPSIVYHFPGKQELYDAVEADIFTSMHAFVVERTDNVSDPMARLLGLLDAWLDFLVARPAAARIIQRLTADVGPRGDDPVRFSETALRDIEAIIAAGVAEGAFRPITATEILNGVASGSLFYVCNGRQLGAARTYDAADPAELGRYRALLHRLARAAVQPEAG
ncbi:transcriptional regulator, TetR family [Sphingomonas laterariae]|uniref:Transcriptional regulator, TetR family n=1 Tax=Edaphosphingomonas laterariae TaxID=861865 RepID=A0A239ETM7_9SPHN|nr:TetR/AcrR family transcriptional regulator [Sphingomonas laterariae]SNS47393.1 transcriptional regulator, TetR family [Sphingomonas laterariae]